MTQGKWTGAEEKRGNSQRLNVTELQDQLGLDFSAQVQSAMGEKAFQGLLHSAKGNWLVQMGRMEHSLAVDAHARRHGLDTGMLFSPRVDDLLTIVRQHASEVPGWKPVIHGSMLESSIKAYAAGKEISGDKDFVR